MMNLTSCGLDLKSMLKIIALIDTDLPVPVAPATNRWGILARSVENGTPPMSLPKAKVIFESAAAIRFALDHFAQIHGLAPRIGNFDTDHRLAGDRR